MKMGKYLKDKQKVVYQTFLNALNTGHLSHAYLLVGEQGTPLLESAIYLAKSLLCDEPMPLACEHCLTCLRIDDHNFADLIIVDGATKSVKKEDVQLIETRFKSSAIENKGKMIYIINHVENMTNEAINSLLKFLEEPHDNIYAFLTCENENKVLPTIISRSQTLHFRSLNKYEMKLAAVKLNVSKEDAELLCNFYNNEELILQKTEDKDYQFAKKCMNETFVALSDNIDVALPILHTKVFSQIKSKEAARFYLDMLTVAFQDLINLKLSNPIMLDSYSTYLTKLSNALQHIEQSLLEIMTCRGQIDMNININLLLDHIFNFILKGAD